MTTQPDDRQAIQREPLGEDGQPIFPSGPAQATGATSADQLDVPDAPDGYDAQPVVQDDYDAEPARSVEAAPPVGTTTEPADPVDSAGDAWLALQVMFVDDPAQAVREAGERVEGELHAFRDRLDSADTEALRTAFKQFRDLSAILR